VCLVYLCLAAASTYSRVLEPRTICLVYDLSARPELMISSFSALASGALGICISETNRVNIVLFFCICHIVNRMEMLL